MTNDSFFSIGIEFRERTFIGPCFRRSAIRGGSRAN